MSSLTYGEASIAGTVFDGIFIIPVIVLWGISFCLARKRADPARSGIRWIKAVLPIYVLMAVFHIALDGLNLVYWYGPGSLWYEDDIYESRYYIGGVVQLISDVLDVVLLVTFAVLAGGFLFCLNGPSSSTKTINSKKSPVFLSSVAFGGLIVILAIAFFGLDTAWYANSARTRTVSARTLSQFRGAIDILLFIAFIPMLGYASFVVHKTKRHLVGNSAVLFLVAVILQLIRKFYTMIYASIWVLPDDPTVDYEYGVRIANSIFQHVFIFVALVLLYVIGIRKHHNGLWSTAPPMDKVGGGWVQPGAQVVYVQQPVAVTGQPQPQYYQQPTQSQPVQQMYPQSSAV